jgi:hypothetical protein
MIKNAGVAQWQSTNSVDDQVCGHLVGGELGKLKCTTLALWQQITEFEVPWFESWPWHNFFAFYFIEAIG